MKKIIALMLVLASVFALCACGGPFGSSSSKYGDQDKFLSDMAQGINDRLSFDEDESKMNADELSAQYLKCVGAELDQIEKYENVTFSDPKFNQIAHEYIAACQMQRTAAENYRNKDFYDRVYFGARTVRYGIIAYLYENYNLPLSSEVASLYS